MTMPLMVATVVTCPGDKWLDRPIFKSPDVKKIVIRCFYAETPRSLASAYNEALEELKGQSEYIALVHDDVHLPADWGDTVLDGIAQVEKLDPDWGVIGIAGAWIKEGDESSGGIPIKCYEGHLLDRGELFLGVQDLPVRVKALDEVCLIVRNDGETRFSPEFPSYHMIGAELCMRLARGGMSSWCIDAYLEHESDHGLIIEDPCFYFNTGILAERYADMLPIVTTCITVFKDSDGTLRTLP